MKLITWIAEESGRGTALAQHLNVTKGAVWQGARYPTGVPSDWHKAVYDHTGAAVGYLDMLSDEHLSELMRRLPFLVTEARQRTGRTA